LKARSPGDDVGRVKATKPRRHTFPLLLSNRLYGDVAPAL
jgi:hypothetical protein